MRVYMEHTGSKTSFVINIYRSYITSWLPAFADSSPGSRSILIPTLPLFYPLERLNRRYISFLQQKAFLLMSTFVILPSLRLLPLKSLKSSWGLQVNLLRLTAFSSHFWHCHFLELPNSPLSPVHRCTARSFSSNLGNTWQVLLKSSVLTGEWRSQQGNGERAAASCCCKTVCFNCHSAAPSWSLPCRHSKC